MGRWYLINLYTLSSFKGTHLLSPWSDLKIKYGIFWEVFPKGGRGGPLFPNLEAKIPPKSDFFEKNKIAPYGLKCKINPKNFQLRGSQKVGGSAIWENFPKNTVFFYFTPFSLNFLTSLLKGACPLQNGLFGIFFGIWSILARTGVPKVLMIRSRHCFLASLFFPSLASWRTPMDSL